jgi:hypothetical protein
MNRRMSFAGYMAPILQWAEEEKQMGNSIPFKTEGLLMTEVAHKETVKDHPFHLPVEFTGKDFLTMLLHVDAEIEHGLMLQYLYAAYSIGGDQVPEQYRENVRSWQNIILGIAKEEMGHFVSVQNVLKLIGAPLNFGRENYPWETPFYPFPFTLEAFSLRSLAKYVYAEAPIVWLNSKDPMAKEIKDSVKVSVDDPHTVGALFKIILQLVKKPHFIPDEIFQPATYPYQAKFEEWGRGYIAGNRGQDPGGNFKTSPEVLVKPLLSRDDAYNVLNQIAEQGEGEDISKDLPSHFERFLFVYKELKEIIEKEGNLFSPARNVAINPYVAANQQPESDTKGMDALPENEAITNPEACLWANLFNIRYRMLLQYLNHSFLLEEKPDEAGIRLPRGLIINSSFGEMYNLRSIAAVLVQKPLAAANTTKMAGPPFLIPYSINLPFGEANRWRLHKECLLESARIRTALVEFPGQLHMDYLIALGEADQKLLNAISGLGELVSR